MIKKIDKPFGDLNIGICGFRKPLLIPSLSGSGVKYEEINEVQGITSDFDFVFVTGMYKLIKKEQLNAPKYGVFGFHETPLPEGKGHAPIQWTILNNRPNLTITLFQLTEGVDAGPIICQYNMHIDPMDTYEIIESKRQGGIQYCFDICLEELKEGILVLRNQSGKESYHDRRTPPKSELDVNKSLKDLWDNIRICDNIRFPAFFILNGKKVILKYEVQNL